MFSKELYGARLREAREKAGETQTALSKVLEGTPTLISDMEKGRRTTGFENLAKLCEHLNVSADYLLGLTDEPRPLTAIEKEGI